MGSKRGNRTPREKKPSHQKSQHYQFRLLPRDDHHEHDQWLIDLIENEQRKGKSLRAFVSELATHYSNRPPVEPLVIVDAGDVVDIKQLVQYIADRLESGDFARTSGRRRKQEPDTPINDAVRSMVDRHIEGGLLEDDED